jgi:hypothetical protein
LNEKHVVTKQEIVSLCLLSVTSFKTEQRPEEIKTEINYNVNDNNIL